jgi:hypothetical protein
LRQLGKPLQQRLEVEHGAADEQRNPAARADVGHHGERVGAETRRRVGFFGLIRSIRWCGN